MAARGVDAATMDPPRQWPGDPCHPCLASRSRWTDDKLPPAHWCNRRREAGERVGPACSQHSLHLLERGVRSLSASSGVEHKPGPDSDSKIPSRQAVAMRTLLRREICLPALASRRALSRMHAPPPPPPRRRLASPLSRCCNRERPICLGGPRHSSRAQFS